MAARLVAKSPAGDILWRGPWEESVNVALVEEAGGPDDIQRLRGPEVTKGEFCFTGLAPVAAPYRLTVELDNGSTISGWEES